MPDYVSARAQVLDALRRELVGPDPQGLPLAAEGGIVVTEDTAWMPRYQQDNGEEILVRDRPDQRYGIGVLYCAGRQLSRPDELEILPGDGPPASADAEGVDPEIVSPGLARTAADALDQLDEPATSDLDLSGANEYRPTTMAVTFLVEVPEETSVTLRLEAGRYEEREVEVGGRVRTWWFRVPCWLEATWDGQTLQGLGSHYPGTLTSEGLESITVETFAVSRPRDGGQTLLTVGVLNATVGSTPNHFLYQVRFHVTVGNPGRLLPYPEVARPERDDEEGSIDLLYRRWPTFAVGHGCAAGWDLDNAQVTAEPLPTVETPSITPQVLRADGSEVRVPMAPLAGLVAGQDGRDSLAEVLTLYRAWIAERELEAISLEPRHREAARRHLDSCQRMADRMVEGLELIAADETVAEAFRLANLAGC